MPYREVIRAEKLGGRVAGHARQHSRRVAKSATDPFRDRLPPDREFLDLYEYQVAVGEELDQMRRELIAIDDQHAREQEADRQVRDQRDDWVAGLRAALLKLKDTLEGSYGPGTSRMVFKEDPPRLPDDPVALHQVGHRVFDAMTDPQFELLPAQPGVAVNPRVLAEGFEPPLRGLGETLERLHDSESETRHTQSQKDVLLQRLATYSGKAARLFEALADLAGHEGLASRLRRSRHARRGDGDGEAGPAPASTDLPAASPAAAEEAPPAPTAGGETPEEATA